MCANIIRSSLRNLLLFQIYSSLSVIRWRFPGTSRSQQGIKATLLSSFFLFIKKPFHYSLISFMAVKNTVTNLLGKTPCIQSF